MLECPICSSVENTTTALEVHIKEEHLDLKPWKCNLCGTTRYMKKQLDGHMQAAHSARNIEVIFVSDRSKEDELERLMELAIGKAIQMGGNDPSRATVFVQPTADLPALLHSIQQSPAMSSSSSNTPAPNNVVKTEVGLSMLEQLSSSQFSDQPSTSFDNLDTLFGAASSKTDSTSDSYSANSEKKFCHLCKKYLLFNYRKREDIVKHICVHMREIYQQGRYLCNSCNYQNVCRSRIVKHVLKQHKDPDGYSDNMINWNVDYVRELSTSCFLDADYVVNIMPTRWKKKWIDDERAVDTKE